MIDDFKPILYNAPKELDYIDLYFLHDAHIGNSQTDMKKLDAFLTSIVGDDRARVIIIGDMMENVVQGSKGDIFYQTLPPHEQREYVVEILKKLSDKLVAVTPGNHERNRTTKSVGLFPLYDACAIAGVQDAYRPHFALVDIGVGKDRKNEKYQIHYSGYCVHRARDQVNYCTSDAIEGIDFFAYGHDHNPKDKPRGKLVYNKNTKKLNQVSVEVINCGAFLKYGGYAVDGAYRPGSDKMYNLRLFGGARRIETFGFYK